MSIFVDERCMCLTDLCSTLHIMFFEILVIARQPYPFLYCEKCVFNGVYPLFATTNPYKHCTNNLDETMKINEKQCQLNTY